MLYIGLDLALTTAHKAVELDERAQAEWIQYIPGSKPRRA
jgi:hypothetical protein